MQKEHIIIIGAGLAGLTASYFLKKKGVSSLILEKEDYLGGLCRSFSINDEWFDIGGHVSFAKDKRVRMLLENNVVYNERLADALNYKDGNWIVHPVQNNLYVLNTDEKIKIIEDYISRPKIDNPSNYKDWLITKYGNYFTDNYPAKYTRKYWTVDPEMLEPKWVKNRMYETSLHEMLYGAFEKKTKNVHYSNGIRYPLTGGFESFIKSLELSSNVNCKMTISSIDLKNKIIKTADGKNYSYDVLINTAPLPEIIKLINGVPDKLKECCQKLYHTSLVLVSICVRGSLKLNYPAFYIYDEDILPSRVFSTSQYSMVNTGYSALQAEVYFSKFKPLETDIETIKNKTISQLLSFNLFEEKFIESVDVKYVPYANIIFTQEIYENRRTIIDYLRENGVYSAGRFGLWDYLWSDQTVISSMDAVDQILKNIKEEKSDYV